MKKSDFNDDGRQIADMSAVSVKFGRTGVRRSDRVKNKSEKTDSDHPPVNLSRSERRRMIRYSIAASLIIGFIFIATAAIFILFSEFIWLK